MRLLLISEGIFVHEGQLYHSKLEQWIFFNRLLQWSLSTIYTMVYFIWSCVYSNLTSIALVQKWNIQKWHYFTHFRSKTCSVTKNTIVPVSNWYDNLISQEILTLLSSAWHGHVPTPIHFKDKNDNFLMIKKTRINNSMDLSTEMVLSRAVLQNSHDWGAVKG